MRLLNDNRRASRSSTISKSLISNVHDEEGKEPNKSGNAPVFFSFPEQTIRRDRCKRRKDEAQRNEHCQNYHSEGKKPIGKLIDGVGVEGSKPEDKSQNGTNKHQERDDPHYYQFST
jgi:hypothetical protein